MSMLNSTILAICEQGRQTMVILSVTNSWYSVEEKNERGVGLILN